MYEKSVALFIIVEKKINSSSQKKRQEGVGGEKEKEERKEMEGEKETKPVIRQWALCESVKINASENTDAQYIFMVCERENSKYIE